MNEEELEQFKQKLTKEYIDASFDRLLDLRNGIKNAINFDEILILMEKEQKFLQIKIAKL